MSRRKVSDPLLITIDLRPIRDAFQLIARAVRQAAREFVRLLTPPDERLPYGRNLDPVTGWWQSDMCAAWLHASCPLPGRCQCKARSCTHPPAAA